MSIDKEPITLFLLRLANARAPSPQQASIGRITLSTSPATMQLSELLLALTKYCGAVLSPARTHGKNVNPICQKIEVEKEKKKKKDIMRMQKMLKRMQH